MDGLVMRCRAQNNKCVQLFKAICIDRGSNNVEITKTLYKQRNKRTYHCQLSAELGERGLRRLTSTRTQ
eukprot:6209739-Pleurochrysis_carterae.AAC.1